MLVMVLTGPGLWAVPCYWNAAVRYPCAGFAFGGGGQQSLAIVNSACTWRFRMRVQPWSLNSERERVVPSQHPGSALARLLVPVLAPIVRATSLEGLAPKARGASLAPTGVVWPDRLPSASRVGTSVGAY